MRLAVPEHQGRIAPVFDCCKRLMIVLQLPLEDELLHNEDWASLPRLTRAARLMELNVELLVCGGISCWMEEQIRRHGIRMIPWVAGDVWEVLAALRQGTDSRSTVCHAGASRMHATSPRSRMWKIESLTGTVSEGA